MNIPDPLLKKEIALFQNEFLILFLKYNLAFHFDASAGATLLNQFKKKKAFLVHCLLHAVFGNGTKKDPVIKIQLAQSLENNEYWLEIESSGAPENFFGNLERYSEDLGLPGFMLSESPSLLYNLKEEPFEITAAKDFSGSRIRTLFN